MQVLCGLQVVFFLFNCQTPVAVGDKIRLAMDTSRLHIFDNVTERTIVD